MGFQTKIEAEEEGKKLVSILGEQWKFQVWNNLGWCVKASLSDSIHVYSNFGQSYNVMVGEGGCMLASLSPDKTSCVEKEDIVPTVKRVIREYKAKFDKFVEKQEALLKDGLRYIGEYS